MFGAKTWPILIGQVSRTYVRKSFPPDLLDKPGTVLERLPGNSGIQTPDGYVWLTQLPKFDQQGPEGWTLGENYDLVPRDGYLAILYGLIKRR
ncbi:hypothetical protein [Verrucomicrobium spinosum]|nr:hypothetical protein [Verrucomicrobium spinosum]